MTKGGFDEIFKLDLHKGVDMFAKAFCVFATILISASTLSAKEIKCVLYDGGWLKDSYGISEVFLDTNAEVAQLRTKGKLGQRVGIVTKTIGVGERYIWSQDLQNFAKDKEYLLEFDLRYKQKKNSVEFRIFYKGKKTPEMPVNCVVQQ